MTKDALKEVLQDRIYMLDHALRESRGVPRWLQAERGGIAFYERDEARLEGRLEELRVCLRLVEQLKLDEEHPLLELSEKGIRRVDDAPDEWGKQVRGDWPNATFGGADVLS
jgi:hypothetical protein